MSEWQPIETAPKDGTEILVWSGGFYLAEWQADARHPDGGKWRTTESDCMDQSPIYLDERLGYTPTHWMPLPAPPKTDA